MKKKQKPPVIPYVQNDAHHVFRRVKRFPFEDDLGPLPHPPVRMTRSKHNLWLEAFIGRKWVTVARRAQRRPFWVSFCENLKVVQETGKDPFDFVKVEKY